MSDVVLSLGNVAFRDMEVPEKIRFGGRQRLAVQNIIGGGRVVGALGLDDGEISFSGIFSGQDAAARAQLLDIARAQGSQMPLVWGGFYYLVVISSFVAEYRRPNLIPFAVTCVVVSDPLADVAAALPLATLIGNDIAAATGFAGQAGQVLAGTSLAALAAAQAGIAGAMGTAGTALGEAGAALAGAATIVAGVNALTQINACSGQLAGLAGMSGYVNRAVVNSALEAV